MTSAAAPIQHLSVAFYVMDMMTETSGSELLRAQLSFVRPTARFAAFRLDTIQ